MSATFQFIDPSRYEIANGHRIVRARLDDISKVLRCHPRSVVRALAGDVNKSWDKTLNLMMVRLDDLVVPFHCNRQTITRCLLGRDVLLDQADAAIFLGIDVKTLRKKASGEDSEYRPVARMGTKCVRYSKAKLQIIRDYEDDKHRAKIKAERALAAKSQHMNAEG